EVDQHGLIRRAEAAVPAHEWQEVVDAEADAHQRPFDAAEGAGDLLRVHLLAGRIERSVIELKVVLDAGIAHLTGRSRGCEGNICLPAPERLDASQRERRLFSHAPPTS